MYSKVCKVITSQCGQGGREGGREVYLQSRLLKRTVLVARAPTALYLAAGLFPLSMWLAGEEEEEQERMLINDLKRMGRRRESAISGGMQCRSRILINETYAGNETGVENVWPVIARYGIQRKLLLFLLLPLLLLPLLETTES